MLIEKAIAERNQLSISSEIVISCYLCEIFVLLSRLTIESLQIKQSLMNDKNTPRMIQAAVYYIHENYTKPISLNDLCEYLERTPQHIIRIFKNYFHKTPIQYINHFRISRSKDLLQYTSLSVNEISYEVGIESPYYFCRLFKKVEGLTPTEFRSSKMMERPQLWIIFPYFIQWTHTAHHVIDKQETGKANIIAVSFIFNSEGKTVTFMEIHLYIDCITTKHLQI